MKASALCTEADVSRTSVSDSPAPPTPKEVDAIISEYAAAQLRALNARVEAKKEQDAADAIKEKLIRLVQLFGARHTEKSMRLAGIHNTATTTIAARTSTDPDAVERFKSYLDSSHMPELIDRFFTRHVSYSLVSAPMEAMKLLSLPARVRDRMTSLLAMCTKVALSSPSLKIETVTPEKPKKSEAAVA